VKASKLACKNVAYSIENDKSTDITGLSQLAVFIRYINEDFQRVKKLPERVLMNGK
jgi:hypothetical protein